MYSVSWHWVGVGSASFRKMLNTTVRRTPGREHSSSLPCCASITTLADRVLLLSSSKQPVLSPLCYLLSIHEIIFAAMEDSIMINEVPANYTTLAMIVDSSGATRRPTTLINEAELVKSSPEQDIWENIRPTIKRLYLDEDKTLKDVMATMQRDFGHKATIKMYQNRITKWGLDKNCKAHEMKAIARKMVKRDAMGKASVFQIRGRQIERKEVLRHLKRKGYQSLEEVLLRDKSPETNTPSDVRCLTPEPSNSPRSSSVTRRQRLSMNDNHRRLSSLNHVSSSLIPPRDLLIPESILLAIKALFQGSLDGNFWKLDTDGCLAP